MWYVFHTYCCRNALGTPWTNIQFYLAFHPFISPTVHRYLGLTVGKTDNCNTFNLIELQPIIGWMMGYTLDRKLGGPQNLSGPRGMTYIEYFSNHITNYRSSNYVRQRLQSIRDEQCWIRLWNNAGMEWWMAWKQNFASKVIKWLNKAKCRLTEFCDCSLRWSNCK
jgi:hypothetical protein